MSLVQQFKNWGKQYVILVASILFFVSASIIYTLLSFIGNHHPVKSPMHSSAYHWTYPNLFIAAFTLSLLLTFLLFQKYFYKNVSTKPVKFYTSFYGVLITMALFFSGILWSYLDMKAGFFPAFSNLVIKVIKDIGWSFIFGGISIATAFPFNIIVLACSFFLIKKVKYILYDNNR
jgi:hypothetical protein